MQVIFEVQKHEEQTIRELQQKLGGQTESYTTNGFDGTQIVALVVALIPTVKELILTYFPKKTVTIKISNDYGSAELTAKTVEELEVMVDKYLAMVEKVKQQSQQS